MCNRINIVIAVRVFKVEVVNDASFLQQRCNCVFNLKNLLFLLPMFMPSVKAFGNILIVSLNELKQNDPLRLAGATAFFTTFALPPILIILVQVIGLVFRVANLRDTFFLHLADLLGRQSAAQVRETFFGFQSLATNGLIAFGGFIFLMFVATTLFKIIKDSLNQLWKVKSISQAPVWLKLKSRIISMTVILLAGILFLGSMLAEGLETFLHEYTGVLHHDTATFLNVLLNQVISVIIVSTWLAVLFKVLPDADVSWKVVSVGGFFTGILFSIGKVIISALLTAGNLTNIFGASGSIVLLLLFVFYCSFILYYGACFTKVYATYIHKPIEAGENAFKYRLVEVKA